MKIGIIVHSFSGNTLSVAERIKEELKKSGNTVNLEQVKAINEDPNSPKPVELDVVPDTFGYDTIILGAPVRGFNLSPVMKKYLSQVGSLTGKTIFCYVTEGFPMPWMGGNHSVKQMSELCTAKGGKIVKTGVVNWPAKKREDSITKLLNNFSKI